MNPRRIVAHLTFLQKEETPREEDKTYNKTLVKLGSSKIKDGEADRF